MPFNHNYRIPPVDTNDTVAMLKYFGVKVESDMDAVEALSVFDKNRLPKLACPKKNNPLAEIVLSFPGPQGFGLQSFAFPIEVWLDFVHSKGSDASVFNCSNPFFTFVVSSFIINKTTLLRVYNHNRGIFKLPLQPSISKINKNLRKNI
jgi:hypothetical protein